MFRIVIMSSTKATDCPEIVPGRLYRQQDLEHLLPSTLRRIVLARLWPIGDVYLGQAMIEILAKEYISEASSTSPPENDVMTLSEVADYLHLSERTIRRMVDRGQLSAEDHRQPGSKKALLRFSKMQIDKDRKKAATQEEQPPVKPRFRL